MDPRLFYFKLTLPAALTEKRILPFYTVRRGFKKNSEPIRMRALNLISEKES